MKKKVTIKQSDKKDLVVPLEILATSIVEISRFGEQIKRSRLNEAAILTLMKDLTGESKATIKKILDALPQLEKTYVRR